MIRIGIVVSENSDSQMIRTADPIQYIELRGGSIIRGAKRGASVEIMWRNGRWIGVKKV